MPSIAPVSFNRGYLSVTGAAEGPYFQLLSSQLLVIGSGGDSANVAAQHHSPAQAGPHSLAASFVGGLGSGYAEIGGVPHQKVFYSGTFNIVGSCTLVNTTASPLVVTAPFSMTGSMKGFPKDPEFDISTPLFSRKVKGKGTAILELTTMDNSGVRIFEFVRITYLFT